MTGKQQPDVALKEAVNQIKMQIEAMQASNQ
jgi:maltose-binding protein MalE